MFKDDELITPELKLFKDGFAVNYGHFCTSFNTISVLKYHFLLQLANFCNDIVLTTENNSISIDGVKLVSLENIKNI